MGAVAAVHLAAVTREWKEHLAWGKRAASAQANLGLTGTSMGEPGDHLPIAYWPDGWVTGHWQFVASGC